MTWIDFFCLFTEMAGFGWLAFHWWAGQSCWIRQKFPIHQRFVCFHNLWTLHILHELEIRRMDTIKLDNKQDSAWWTTFSWHPIDSHSYNAFAHQCTYIPNEFVSLHIWLHDKFTGHLERPYLPVLIAAYPQWRVDLIHHCLRVPSQPGQALSKKCLLTGMRGVVSSIESMTWSEECLNVCTVNPSSDNEC